MRCNLHRVLLVATATFSLAAASHVRAAVLAYEGWDYTAGGTFVGGAGGVGFSGPWLLNGGSALNSIALNGSLSYNDGFGNLLVTAGNRGLATGDGSATGDNIGGTSAGASPLRPFSFQRGFDGTTVSTWISVLALRTGIPNPTPGAPPADYLFGRAAAPAQFFYQSVATATAAGNEMFGFGRGTQSSETDTSLANDTWAIVQQGNANAAKVSNVNFASAPADFLLLRVDHIGGATNDLANADTLRLWINPRLDVAPSDASADVFFNANEYAAALAVNRDFVFNKLRLFGGNVQTTPSGRSYGAVEVDELRVGESFADVAPFTLVPEPSVVLLGGLAALVLFWRRK